MILDLTPLKKAINQLGKSLQFARSEDAKKNEELFIQFRAASIQAFEYSYELCVKMLQRHLELSASSTQNIDHLSFRDLVRTGAEKGLIPDPEKWFSYRELRNITAHTYDEAKADRVYQTLPAFLRSAEDLLKLLQPK
ncbi:MAG: HI0074 family nucleotidyltransferase substrate-binding subunit [Candidatus Omnitrophota bacterium]